MFSVQGMTITMLDSAAGMRAMLHSSPGQWPEAARRLWEPMAGMYFFIPGGPDMAAVHGRTSASGRVLRARKWSMPSTGWSRPTLGAA